MKTPRDCKKFIEMMEKSGIITVKYYHNKKLRIKYMEIYPVLNEMPKIPLYTITQSSRDFNKNIDDIYYEIYDKLFDTNNGYLNMKNSSTDYSDYSVIHVSSKFEQMTTMDQLYNLEYNTEFLRQSILTLYEAYHPDFYMSKFYIICKCLENSKSLDEFKVNCVLNGIELAD